MRPLVAAWRRGEGTQAAIAARHGMPTPLFGIGPANPSRRVRGVRREACWGLRGAGLQFAAALAAFQPSGVSSRTRLIEEIRSRARCLQASDPHGLYDNQLGISKSPQPCES